MEYYLVFMLKFKIINLIKELIINIDRNLVNFLKRDIEYKKEISTIF